MTIIIIIIIIIIINSTSCQWLLRYHTKYPPLILCQILVLSTCPGSKSWKKKGKKGWIAEVRLLDLNHMKPAH